MEHNFECVKLHFCTPLHLSRGRDQYDESATTLHSDTLYAALFMSACQLGISIDEAIKMLDSFQISSAFPFYDDEYFFPKPLAALPFEINGKSKEKQGKSFKKIRYLGKSWFEKVINGTEAILTPEMHLKQPEYLTERHIKTVFKKDVVQRVTIAPDYCDDATPFYTERLYFGDKSGLFVLVRWLDSNARDIFKSAFKLLGDLGIGTDKSVGNGFFNPSYETLSLRLPNQAKHQCALGLFIPEIFELDGDTLEDSSWNLTKRGGYLAGAADLAHMTLRKKSIYMFDVGSVFPARSFSGKRVNLKPNWQGLDHPVWRDGRPIFIPIVKTSTI